MIKPIKTTPINTTKYTYSECRHCGFNVEIYWENRLINTDSMSDMEDILFEPCPKCGKILGSKNDFIIILGDKVETAVSVCNYLLNDSSNNEGLIKEYRNMFDTFLKDKDINTLKEIDGIFYRPSPEGSTTDFTTVTKVNFNCKYISLDDLIEDIQRLLLSIENALD